MGVGTKTATCPICKRTLPHSEFTKNRSKPYGIDGYCRACMADYKRAYRARKASERRPIEAGEFRLTERAWLIDEMEWQDGRVSAIWHDGVRYVREEAPDGR